MADELTGYLAGLVLECEAVPNKDKLRKLKVDVGRGLHSFTSEHNLSNTRTHS